MNEYLKPTIFWSMIGFATLLCLLCLMAGQVWQPFVVGVVTAASVVEWGIEQRWPDRMRVVTLYWRVKWVDGELQGLRREIYESRTIGDEEDAQALQVYYMECVKHRQRLRERVTDLRYELEGAIEGVDYPRI